MSELLSRLTPLRRRSRSGLRLYCHLPRWRYSPRSWSLGVVVQEGKALLASIDPIDHRPTFIQLAPGHHELTIVVMGAVRELARLTLSVDVHLDQVVSYELERPTRGAIGPRNRPTGVRVRT